MSFACLLMSDSELLRIKNKRKASYKSRKTARSNQKSLHGLMTDLGSIAGWELGFHEAWVAKLVTNDLCLFEAVFLK